MDVASRNLQLGVHTQDSAIARALIDHEAERVDGEQQIARTFTEVDPRLFSRNEILDAVGDLQLLTVQDAYFAWQAQTHDQRTQAELHRLVAFRDASQSQLDQQESALAVMELTSPADGTFVYARTPWGQKLTRGHHVFPGRAVGLLPVRGKVKARIYVPEVDAIGIAIGQEAMLRLDSDVSVSVRAVVSSVSTVATPRASDNPQKYFVVEAEPESVDAELMRVGSSLDATIVTGAIEGSFLLPQQAVFYDDNEPFVYVVRGTDASARQVRLGHMSPTLVEVTHGLEAGEQVSVVAPDGVSAAVKLSRLGPIDLGTLARHWLPDLRQAAVQLAHHRLRSALTLLGMIFGVGAVIAMLAVSEGGRRQALAMIEGMGVDNLIVDAEEPQGDERREARKHSAGLSVADARALLETLPFVHAWAGVRVIHTWNLFSRQGESHARVWAVSPPYFELTRLEAVAGRLFSTQDNDQFAQVAILGEGAARQLFPNGDALGQFVKVNHLWVKVVGVLRDRQLPDNEFQGERVGGEGDRVYLPLHTALRRFACFSLGERAVATQAARDARASRRLPPPTPCSIFSTAATAGKGIPG